MRVNEYVGQFGLLHALCLSSSSHSGNHWSPFAAHKCLGSWALKLPSTVASGQDIYRYRRPPGCGVGRWPAQARRCDYFRASGVLQNTSMVRSSQASSFSEISSALFRSIQGQAVPAVRCVVEAPVAGQTPNAGVDTGLMKYTAEATALCV